MNIYNLISSPVQETENNLVEFVEPLCVDTDATNVQLNIEKPLK